MQKEKKKSKECTAQSVSKTSLKTERIEKYGERQIYITLVVAYSLFARINSTSDKTKQKSNFNFFSI